VRLAIHHVTHYDFDQPIARGLQRLRLTPKPTSGQRVLEWAMTVEGGRREVEYDDQNHNRTTLISVLPGARELTVTCQGLVDTSDQLGVIGRHAGHLPLWHFRDPTPATTAGSGVRKLLNDVPRGSDMLETMHRLSAAIIGRVRYGTGSTHADTGAEEAVAAGWGVCQDHAHIFIACARMLGLPARYVSGYLMMEGTVEQEAGHAWAEVFIDGLGWVGFDVSNGISPDQRYVRVASGRDYREAAPVTGISYGAHEEVMKVRLAVEQQHVEQ
jgi:transglutaminase-like putative cysteine protease